MEYFLVAVVSLLVSPLTLYSGFGLGTLLMPVFAFFFRCRLPWRRPPWFTGPTMPLRPFCWVGLRIRLWFCVLACPPFRLPLWAPPCSVSFPERRRS